MNTRKNTKQKAAAGTKEGENCPPNLTIKPKPCDEIVRTAGYFGGSPSRREVGTDEDDSRWEAARGLLRLREHVVILGSRDNLGMGNRRYKVRRNH